MDPFSPNPPREPLPMGIRLGIAFLVLLAVGALVNLLRPAAPPRIVPLLGYETSPPTPSPRATPARPGPRR